MYPYSYRHTWVEVSLEAVQHNVKAFKEHIHDKCKMIAVVKADGYGHGAVEVAKAALRAGAEFLAVAFADEGIRLRKAGIDSPILILGYSPPEAMEAAIDYDLTLTVMSSQDIVTANEVAERLMKSARIHIKVNSGMNRIGVEDKQELLSLIKKISDLDHLQLEGVFTHFADADNEDPTYTEKQFRCFMDMISLVKKQGLQIPLVHCANTAASISYPDMHLDMVRIGIGLYGLYPSAVQRESIHLRPVMSFKTKVAAVNKLPEQQFISYGCSYKTTRPSIISTLPVGYADGLSRLLSNSGFVTVNEHQQRVPIVGRVCMDQTMIDTTDIPQVKQGDLITLFGDEAQGEIPIHEIADQIRTIHYEIVTLIGKRVPRLYIKSQEGRTSIYPVIRELE